MKKMTLDFQLGFLTVEHFSLSNIIAFIGLIMMSFIYI